MDISGASTTPYWWDAVDSTVSRQQLSEDIEVDVAIIGAGFTGLGCAYYLKQLDPGLSVENADLSKRMQQAISKNLNPLFKIYDVVVVDKLPRTASNKVMRRVLRREYKPRD